MLGARIGSTGSYSPATRPEIFYSNLRPGFYRLVVALANNDGSTTPYHDVTNFQILERPGHEIADCVAARSPAPRPPPQQPRKTQSSASPRTRFWTSQLRPFGSNARSTN